MLLIITKQNYNNLQNKEDVKEKITKQLPIMGHNNLEMIKSKKLIKQKLIMISHRQ